MKKSPANPLAGQTSFFPMPHVIAIENEVMVLFGHRLVCFTVLSQYRICAAIFQSSSSVHRSK